MLKKLFKFGGSSNFGKLPFALITVIGFSLIILVWHFVTYNEYISPKILPNPFNVIGSIPSLITEYDLFSNIWFTVKLNIMCYVYAILIALPVGFFLAIYPINNILFGRYINSVRFIPVPALSGVFIFIFGLTFGMKIAFLTFCILIYLIPTVANKVNDLQNPNNPNDHVLLQTIQTMGASNWQKFKHVYFPYVTSEIASDCINLVAISYSYVVICEMIYKDGMTIGIGAMINTMIRQSYMAEAFALLFIIIIIGCLQDFLLTRLAERLFPYKFTKNA